MSLKPKRLSVMVLILAVGLVGGGRWYLSVRAQKQADNSKGKPAQTVRVKSALAERRDVPEAVSVTGFVTPLATVDIRSQVLATIQRIHVKEGQNVKAGQILFSLDDRGANADSNKLAAQVVKDQVALEDAQRTLKRNTELLAKNFIAKSVVDSAQSVVDGARATLEADKAALASARVTVDYRRIDAPIAGRVGEIKVHVGSLVQSGGTDVITTVTQIAPINVTFNIPERHVGTLLTAQRAGPVAVEVKTNGEKQDGKLSFIDNTIDPTAGSIKARAVFDNPQSVLWPGALVDVTLALRTLSGAIVVPPRAIQVGPSGQFVYAIAEDSTVSAIPVKIDYLTADAAVVSGIQEGLRVVTDGGQNLRPGQKVVEADTKAKGTADNGADKANGEASAGKPHPKAAP